MNTLIEFYGRECPHCLDMDPLIEKLHTEEGIEIEKMEVWHDAVNAKKMEEYDKNYCGGVPFFINTKTNKWICGSTDYASLKSWALGK